MKKSLLSIAIVAVAACSQAAIIYSTGFEEAGFATGGTIIGNEGWASWGGAQNDAGLAQTGIVSGGDQAAQYTKAVNGNSAYDFGGFVSGSIRGINTAATVADPIFRLSFDMRLGQAGRFSEFWGMGDFASQDTARFAFGADAAGNVVIGDTLSSMTVTGATVTRNTWNNYKVEFNAFSGATNYYLNNALIASDTTSGQAGFGFLTMVAWSAQSDDNDTAYFDNVSVEAVPEPASLAILGLGAAALLRRRRR